MEGLLLALYLVVQGLGWLLRALNLRHLERHGATVPSAFAGAVDPDLLRRTAAYTVARSRAALVESLAGAALLALFLFGGLLPLYDRTIARLDLSSVAAGVLFFLGLHLAQTLLHIPFSLYRNFRIERRFGFNAMSFRLWFSDLLKSAALTSLLLMLLAGGGLALVTASPDRWWLSVWLLFAAVSLFLIYLSPYLVEPLFFSFEPVRRAGLVERIAELAERAGLRVGRVLQVDASRRSRHSNAYVTGIGRVRRIVLFDTLLEQMTDDEVLAVLAHEVGHWKMGHLWKRLLTAEVLVLCGCLLGYRLLEWGGCRGWSACRRRPSPRRW